MAKSKIDNWGLWECDDGSTYHAIPNNDARGHQHSTRCWCSPRLYHKRNSDGNRLYIHHAVDGRRIEISALNA